MGCEYCKHGQLIMREGGLVASALVASHVRTGAIKEGYRRQLIAHMYNGVSACWVGTKQCITMTCCDPSYVMSLQ